MEGIEVDHSWRDAREKIIDSHPSERTPAPVEVTLKPGPSISQAKQRWSSGVCLSTGLAMGIALAAIAASVAGFIAVQRQSRLNSCIQAKDALTTSLNSSCSAPAPFSNISNTTNTTTPSIHDIKPISECRNLSSPVTSARGSTYSLQCGIDLIETESYGVLDLMGVYVYTFTDCINACANYNDHGITGGHGNSSCNAVSYNFVLKAEQGNCWLKSHEKIPFHSNHSVDSAILEVS